MKLFRPFLGILFLLCLLACESKSSKEGNNPKGNQYLDKEIERFKNRVEESGRPPRLYALVEALDSLGTQRRDGNIDAYRKQLTLIQTKLNKSKRFEMYKLELVDSTTSFEDLLLVEALVLGRANEILNTRGFQVGKLNPVVQYDLNTDRPNSGKVILQAGSYATYYILKVELKDKQTGEVLKKIESKSNQENEMMFDFGEFTLDEVTVQGEVSLIQNGEMVSIPVKF